MPSDAALAHEQSLRNPNFLYAKGSEDVDVLLRGLATLLESEGPLGIDTETTGLDPLMNRVRLVQIATADFALVVDLNGWRSGEERQVAWDAEGLIEVQGLLEGPRPKVLQNAAFDLNFLLGEGVVLGGPIFDTLVAAKLVNNGTGAKNDLGSIVQRVLKCEMPKELQKADWGGEITDEMLVYSARDAICLPRLCGPLSEALVGARVKEGTTLWDIFRLEMQALRPIALMQWHGFGFDLGEAQALRETLVAQADALQLVFLGRLDEEIRRRHPEDAGVWLPREEDGSFNTREKDSGVLRLGTKRYAGFNPRSPQQMAKRFEQAGILLPPNEKGLPSLDQNLLAFQRKEEPLIDAYLTWKGAVTRVSHVEKLIDSVGPDGRIHAGYRQMGTDTGRLSCIAEGQRVLAPNGSILIENVQIGDYVYSLDDTGAPCVKRVTNKWCNGQRDTVVVTWEAKGHQDPKYGELICTADHLLRTDRGWVKAEELQVKESVWHLRRTCSNDRPRLYWRDYGCKQEQVVIKETYFGKKGRDWHIHHKDHDKYNNSLNNLEVMSHREHLAHHGRLAYPHWLFTDETRAKAKANNEPKYGPDNPRWHDVSRYTLLRMLAKARGRLTYVPMDFDTYKRKCALMGIDLKALSRRYGAHGTYLNKANVEETYNLTGNLGLTSTLLGIGTRRLNDLMLEYGILRSNHRVLSVWPAGKRTVYDLEIEDTHNFIVEELCVHNCATPNLQQVPREKEFRSLFKAAPGHALVVADFSQIELRVAAELSGEPRMLEAYQAGRDLHTETAMLITQKDVATITKADRTSAKVANFGLLYGAGPATLQKQAVAQYGIDMPLSEAKQLVEGFRAAYPVLYEWQMREGNKTTAAVFTALGRRRMLVGFNDKYTTRINTQVQGTAGDIAKLAIARIWQHIMAAPLGEARLIAMVHDEIVLEVRQGTEGKWSELLQAAMESAGAEVCTQVPIVAEVSTGATWAEAK